jgi:hypothetical protein
VAGLILGCDCDDGLCRHIQHVITTSTRDCIEYNPDLDSERVHELKEFTRERRKELYAEILAAQ